MKVKHTKVTVVLAKYTYIAYGDARQENTNTIERKMDANSKKPAENEKKTLISLIKDTLLRAIVA